MQMLPEQIGRARELRAQGLAWDVIATRLGLGLYKVHATLDPVWGKRRSEQSVAAQARRKLNRIKLPPERHGVKPKWRPEPIGKVHFEHFSWLEIPAPVLADREARQQLEHRDLTAAFCGDPLPGRSALDKRRA